MSWTPHVLRALLVIFQKPAICLCTYSCPMILQPPPPFSPTSSKSTYQLSYPHPALRDILLFTAQPLRTLAFTCKGMLLDPTHAACSLLLTLAFVIYLAMLNNLTTPDNNRDILGPLSFSLRTRRTVTSPLTLCRVGDHAT